MGDWIAFWDSEHSIYVNARHRDVHYRTIAQDIRAHLPPDATVLDYGCGEALSAGDRRRGARRLILCDAAPKVRAALAARFAGHANIEVRSPDEIAGAARRLARCRGDAFGRAISHARRTRCAARAVPAAAAPRRPVHPRRRHPAGGLGGDRRDGAAALCRARTAFSSPRSLGLARTVALTDYWRLRSNLGLTRYGEAAMLGKLDAAGFSAQRAPANIGHNPARMTFLARPA